MVFLTTPLNRYTYITIILSICYDAQGFGMEFARFTAVCTIGFQRRERMQKLALQQLGIL